MDAAREILNTYTYVPTLNQMGYMSPALDEIQMAFVEHCENNPHGNFLDIGCGFGVATLPVVNRGCRIVACDLEQQHLDVLKKSISRKRLPLVTFIKGHFPNEVTFPENHFDGINLSMVIHFLSAPLIEKALRNIFIYLKEGGRLFITTSSPYQKVLSPFLPIYEKKRLAEEWPGYIRDIGDYVPHRAHLLPRENIVFCKDELSRLVSKFNFRVKDSLFFSREAIPQDLALDGREYSGVICEKPKKSVALLEKCRETIPTNEAKIRQSEGAKAF